MWTPTTRQRYSRTGLRYASDLTDAEWALIAPLLPAACGRGRPRSWLEREILDAIFYVLRGGIAWRLVPTDFPPWPTVYRWFAAWRDAGLFVTINHALVTADRERAGRGASPTAGARARRRRPSTASRSRPLRAVGHGATTRPRRSTVASATPSSIRTDAPCSSRRTRPTSRTATAPCRS